MKLLIPLFLLVHLYNTAFCGQKDSLSIYLEHYIDAHDPHLAIAKVLLDYEIQNPSLCKGPSGTYYLTGTTGDINGVHEGIKVWASRDLINWNLIGRNGYVWTFENAVVWQKKISKRNGWNQRGIIAPEIHYINNNFWITNTNSNTNQSGILKSLSGKAQGPYEEVSGDAPLVKGTNASLFMDSDSTVYFLWDNGYIQKLNNEMSDFVPKSRHTLIDNTGNTFETCCVNLSKIGSKYILTGSVWDGITDDNRKVSRGNIDARFDGFIASSNNIYGPYTRQRKKIPHVGDGHIFKDFQENYWYVFSGNDISNPITSTPSIIPLEIDENSNFNLRHDYELHAGVERPIVYVSKDGNNSLGSSWDNAFTDIQRAIDLAPNGSQLWIARGKYDAPVELNLRDGLYLYGGFIGIEESLLQRDIEKNKVILNGKNYAKHVISISTCSYIRIDGITIQGGNASGGSFHHHYGAGIHMLGGGETIRIVNCHFENNKADQDGGGLYASIGAAPTVINCTFKNNVSKNNGGAVAIYCNSSNGYNARFYNCIFDNNFSYGNGAAIYFDTNKKDFGLLLIVNCLVSNNTTLKESGALSLDRNSNLLMLNSTFCFNKGTAKGAVIGKFGNVPAKSRIVNSIFYQNYGGKLFSIEGEAELARKNNKIYYPNIWVQFTNCLFDANEVSALVQRSFDKKNWRSVNELNKSILGLGCIQGTPSFVDPINGNYHYNGGSKAKGTGTSKYFFGYNLDGKKRKNTSINVGCF